MAKKLIRIVTLFLLTIPPSLVAAQNKIPDPKFREVLSLKYGITFDSLNTITNPETAASIDLLDLDNIELKTIEGIEAFTSLSWFSCSGNDLSELNLSTNFELYELTCDNNNLRHIDLSSNVKLTSLDCRRNPIGNLNLESNIILESLSCGDCSLTNLDVSSNKKLWFLSVKNNPQLTSLKFPDNKELRAITNGTPYHQNVIFQAMLLLFIGICSLGVVKLLIRLRMAKHPTLNKLNTLNTIVKVIITFLTFAMYPTYAMLNDGESAHLFHFQNATSGIYTSIMIYLLAIALLINSKDSKSRRNKILNAIVITTYIIFSISLYFVTIAEKSTASAEPTPAGWIFTLLIGPILILIQLSAVFTKTTTLIRQKIKKNRLKST